MIGKTFGQYRVLEKLGQGGMGVVYLAHDAKLERKVALKFLPPDVAQDDLARERFRREALAAAAIDHPFLCNVYEIDDVDGQAFIAMEYVDGQTLKQRLKEGPVSLAEGLRLGEEIAGALAEAHERGIVHRDLKPSNVMLTSDGHAKVMDFGLAKSTLTGRGDAGPDLEPLTGTGMTTGTLAYMSPEQIEGGDVDARSDLFAFAVVFHELLTGRHPFARGTPIATTTAILTEAAPSLRGQVAAATQQLDSLLQRMLARNPDDRVQTMGEVRDTLRVLQERHFGRRASTKRQLGALVGVSILVIWAVALLLPYRSRLNVERARASVPEIERLALAGDYLAASDLAAVAARYLPDDSALAEIRPVFTDMLTVISEPPGALVYLERFVADEADRGDERQLLGTTPIDAMELPRGEYKASIEMADFVTVERLVSSQLNRAEVRLGADPAIRIEATMVPSADAPPDMVFVPGGEYGLIGWRYLSPAALDDFYIDRYEVTNQGYQDFIRAGGYSNGSFWIHPIRDGDGELALDEAMRLFLDRSGLPGPREWSNQQYPEGEARHPVTGVSWYEAAAYAQYAGKALPTIYQWEKAARNGLWTHFEGQVMPWGLVNVNTSASSRANYYGSGTEPVDAFSFGISPYGAYNMAGNAGEWIRNERGAGYAAMGGSWEDASYVFASGEARPALEASGTVGFRLVSRPEVESRDQGSGPIVRSAPTVAVTPVDDATYQAFMSHYRYDERDLDVQLIEQIETPDWWREKLTFNGVEDRVIAYLYLPKQAQQPFQLINWMVSSTAFQGRTAAEEVEAIMAPQLKAGRAVFAVVPRGAIERPWPEVMSAAIEGTVVDRDMRLLQVTEFRIGLDYLETRPEVDMSCIAHVGFSWGASSRAIVFDAVEPRICSIVYIGGALRPTTQLPEVNAWNFAPRVTQPTLVLTGRYDEENPYDPWARDLYELLGGPKRLELVDSGHLPPVEIRNPIISEFLDETLGAVSR
jgi:formylglycine-generating enzyme required for sulfatase activity/predicted Ser/Thr protein kinase